MSLFLKDKLSDRSRDLLDNKQGGWVNPLRLQLYVLQDLNLLIEKHLIYDAGRFGTVRLGQETQQLLCRNPHGEDLVRLNRLLLEDAYPGEIMSHHFIAVDTVAGRHSGYIRTRSGELLELGRRGIAKMVTPGVCEAIVASPSGTLLASFGKLGVFEYSTDWHKLLDCPYPDRRGTFKVHMAAREGQIALAVRPMPMRVGPPGSEPVYAAPGGLWISRGQEWLEVVLPNGK